MTTSTDITRYGTAETMAWVLLHPRLTHRGPWLEHAKAERPILHGALLRLKVERLPGDRDPKGLWLWCSATGAPARTWTADDRRSCVASTWRALPG